ncbi:hypothetical protein L596_016612 [Steinernema carpocapsae]|uniref:Uncharacterized protein n=1 Tax=Steinernema carpocapsae TaxID=34508 RepID=A0A4U5NJB8_STECR|nr:hypothetical protein L596_016612 [Steinernema carpocapsae]
MPNALDYLFLFRRDEKRRSRRRPDSRRTQTDERKSAIFPLGLAGVPLAVADSQDEEGKVGRQLKKSDDVFPVVRRLYLALPYLAYYVLLQRKGDKYPKPETHDLHRFFDFELGRNEGL